MNPDRVVVYICITSLMLYWLLWVGNNIKNAIKWTDTAVRKMVRQMHNIFLILTIIFYLSLVRLSQKSPILLYTTTDYARFCIKFCWTKSQIQCNISTSVQFYKDYNSQTKKCSKIWKSTELYCLSTCDLTGVTTHINQTYCVGDVLEPFIL